MGSDNATASPDRSRGPWFEGRAEAPTADELADRYRDALLRIGVACENYVAPHTCRASSGRVRDAEYDADRWCTGCIAAEALSVPTEAPGCDDNGVPSPEVTDWVLNVYARSVDILTALFMELRPADMEWADHLARTCLARLAKAEPPITVELLGE